jgi:hypothetical protein
MSNLSAASGVHDVSQRVHDDMTLKFTMKRNTKMMSHHEGHKQSPRRLGVFRNIKSNRDRNRGDIPAFDGALNQRGGLMADRSGR